MQFVMIKAKKIFCLIISVMFFAVALHPGPLYASDWIDVPDLEERLSTLEEKGSQIDEKSLALLEAVGKTMLADLNDKQQELIEKVDEWKHDIDNVRTEDLHLGINEALEIARINGLDVPKLKRIYELTKKIIRWGEFEVAAKKPPPEELKEENLDSYYDTFISYVSAEEEAIEKANQQEYRLRIYKRAALAFLNALISSEQPPGECTEEILASGPAKTVELNGHNVTLMGCPDPVVKNLRDYLNIIREMASTEVDLAAKETEILVAQQQLAADVIAGIPLVGDAIDIYSVYAGENLAGVKMSELERGFIGIMVLLPNIGVDVGALLAQGAKRVPGFTAITTALGDGLSFVLRSAKDSRLGVATMQAYQATAEGIAKRWNTTVEGLDDLLAAIGTRPHRNVRFLNDALEQASHGRRLISELPEEARILARARSQDVVDGTLGKLRQARQASGMVEEHMEAFLGVAKRSNEIYIVRPVNKKCKRWIEMGYSTKPMPVKAKSASHGPFAGLIPVDQNLNKLGSELKQARAALEEAADDMTKRAKIQQHIDELNKKLDDGMATIDKCRKTKCAKEVPFKIEGAEVKKSVHPETGEEIFVVQKDGKWLDADELGEGREVSLGFEPADPKVVTVLADENGVPYTADYDFLNYGEKGPHSRPGYKETTGFITDEFDGRIRELNEEAAEAFRAGREIAEESDELVTEAVSHHGAEQLNPYTPGVDYPLTVVDGTPARGEVFVIPECEEDCMMLWCETTRRCDPTNICPEEPIAGCVKVDPDRLLKDYYHDKRLAGYNLDPNPRWGWDEYNALSGWTHPEVHPGAEYVWPSITARGRMMRQRNSPIRKLIRSYEGEGQDDR